MKALKIFKYCVMLGIGYFEVFLIKWILVDLLFNRGLIQTSISQFSYRYSIYFFIELLVLLWIIVLRQHFFQHMFFTYRYTFLICIFLIIYILFKTEYKEEKK